MTAAGLLADPRAGVLRRAIAAREALGSLYPFEPHALPLDGEHAHLAQAYVDEGDRDAPPCLLLHGNPTWSFAWRRLIPFLAEGHRVVAPDHVGMGLSDKPQGYPYSLRRHVENVERLVLALDLSRITLVLHDWGGAIGMGFARRHPERVARLVLMNTAAFPAASIPQRIALCRWPGVGPFAVRRLNGFARAATTMTTRRPLPPAVRAGYLWPYGTWADRVAILRFVQDIPTSREHPSWSELAAIDAALPAFRDRPACLIWGERDWCFTPAFRRAWEERLPGAESHPLPDAAHYLFEDQPQALEAHLAAFLAAHPVRSRAR
jgi:haloalkane dehalogenase